MSKLEDYSSIGSAVSNRAFAANPEATRLLGIPPSSLSTRARGWSSSISRHQISAVHGGRARGASTVAVMTGRFSSEELVDAGAVGVLESISELRPALDHRALDRAVARRDDECDLSDTCSASPVRDVRS